MMYLANLANKQGIPTLVRQLSSMKLKKVYIKSVLVLLTLYITGCSQPSSTTDTSLDDVRPNVIFMLVDDMGSNDLSYLGSEIQTPNIDRLADAGVKFDQGYAYPICSPTRAALMTGLNPLRLGVDGPMENNAMLQADLPLMPEFFKQAGYYTTMVGKWHLGMAKVSAMPQSRGFDYFYGNLGGFVDFYTHVYFGGKDWQRNGKTLHEEGYATDLVTDDAIKQIEEREPSKPFFMYLSYIAPHTPLQYPPTVTNTYDEIESSDRKVFAQMMDSLDTAIGRITKVLEQQGILDNTIVVFMSDNGGANKAGASNGQYRGGKGSSYEGGIRVPMFITWPGKLDADQHVKQPMFVQDWLPTLLDAVDVNYEPSSFTGVSMWNGILKDEWKSRPNPVILGTAKEKAVIDWPYKLINTVNNDSELFNLEVDPFESTNIIAQNQERAITLQKLIEDLPKKPSKGAKGPPPESLFVDENGNFIYDIRKPETREPWADVATEN